jgi:signal transduction histidine kinase
LTPSVLKWKIRNLIAGRQYLENLEVSLAEADQKIDELESFLQMVAHDLKSPAAAVSGFVRLLKRTASRMALDERINEILIHLSNASNTIQEFLQDVSAFMVTEQMDLEWAPLKIEETVQEVVDQHRHLISEKDIELKLNLGTAGLTGIGDKRRIQQVLDNLVRNAIFHMGDVAEPLICITVEEQNDFIVAGISDNGVGIPAEYREQVFDKYFRVPRTGLQPGTGLGLFIARCIVETHGGRIWIESTPEGGATVNFTVPKHSPTN